MEVIIKDLGINGEGVTRLQSGDNDNKVCFVDFSLPGETVDIEITSSKSKFCKGRLLKVIDGSVDRVEPKCPYFTKCGGCDLQHLDYKKQVEFKKEKVSTALRKCGSENFITNTKYLNEYEYRNKMVFAVREENGRQKIGMFESKSHKVIEIGKCLLTTERINNVFSICRDYLKTSTFHGYNEKTKKGDIKYLVIREYLDSILVTIVTTKKFDFKPLFDILSSTYKVGLSIVISNSDDEILSGKYIQQYGIDALEINEYGIDYRVNNLGFLQVNNGMKKLMYDRVLECIDSSAEVIDAYSGAGLLSAIVSKKAKTVTGIEINKSASMSAVDLANKNQINNIEFICDDVEKSLGGVLSKINNATIILDPPRSGCSRVVVNKIVDAVDRVCKIIYISCNPATLGRDVEILSSAFNLEVIEPYDLFPQTKHIETLVVMKRK